MSVNRCFIPFPPLGQHLGRQPVSRQENRAHQLACYRLIRRVLLCVPKRLGLAKLKFLKPKISVDNDHSSNLNLKLQLHDQYDNPIRIHTVLLTYLYNFTLCACATGRSLVQIEVCDHSLMKKYRHIANVQPNSLVEQSIKIALTIAYVENWIDATLLNPRTCCM